MKLGPNDARIPQLGRNRFSLPTHPPYIITQHPSHVVLPSFRRLCTCLDIPRSTRLLTSIAHANSHAASSPACRIHLVNTIIHSRGSSRQTHTFHSSNYGRVRSVPATPPAGQQDISLRAFRCQNRPLLRQDSPGWLLLHQKIGGIASPTSAG